MARGYLHEAVPAGNQPDSQAKRIMIMLGIIASIQTFGARMNPPSPLHFLLTEGGVDKAGLFHKIPRIDDSRLADLLAREVLGFLVHKELLSPEWAERLLSWRHTGVNVHRRVRAKTKTETERVGKYMIRPLLSMERIFLDGREGKVGYRYGKKSQEVELLDYLEFIARVTSHIPDKGQVTVRYCGLYNHAHRGKVKKASLGLSPLRILEDELQPIPTKGWAEMIRIFFFPRRRSLYDFRQLPASQQLFDLPQITSTC